MRLKIAALGAKGIPHPGGIELVMEELGSRLVQRGHQFDIFVRKHYMAGKGGGRYKGMGLPRSPGWPSKNLDALTHSASALPFIITEPYNLVYINSVGLSALALVPRIMGRKVVVHTHGLDWKREKWGPVAQRLLRLSAWSSVKLPHLTFCVCLEDKRFLEKAYGQPCVYLPNGIPQVIHRPPDEISRYGLQGQDYLLFMARLVPEKGAHLLLQAFFSIPPEQRRRYKLVIAGDSNHRDAYYQSLMAFQELEEVIFTGFAVGKLKQELLTNAAGFIQPSTLEGMPLSLLEAMGYGRMILASSIQENKDVLNGHGRLFRAGDWKDLAEKLVEIMSLNDAGRLAEGEKLARFGLKTYNWDEITDKLENHLISLFK
jgi:glycosyltransferase involved in cell wall biosynthesis